MAALSPAVAQNAPTSTLPQSLIEQLNRASDLNIPFNPGQSVPSPLDQVRTPQQQPQLQQQLLLEQRLHRPAPPSQLELDYARRTGRPLPQYGYDLFRTIVPSSGDLQNGAVADNYRLSIGDELVITLRGQVSRSVRTRIDREGRLVIPDLPPLPAAGRTFGEVRRDLEQAVATNFLNTNVFVSVGNVRQISVAVLGEAMAPGLYRMGGFATVLDALAMAGGVKKTGSLRRIVVIHGDQRSTIDLYAVTAAVGTQPDLGISDGDRIIIPPIGRTVGIAGEVDRPGIYELSGGTTIGAAELLGLAGGALRPTGNRFVRLSLDAESRDRTSEVAAPARLTLQAGDILMVLRKDSGTVGSVWLDGHVAVPGIRSLVEAPSLRRLLGSTTFLDTPSLLFGVVLTKDAGTKARRLVPVDLQAALDGRHDVPLHDGDIVIVLSMGDVNYIDSADVQAVLAGRAPPLMRQQIVTRNPRAAYVPQLARQSAGFPGAYGTAVGQPYPPGQTGTGQPNLPQDEQQLQSYLAGLPGTEPQPPLFGTQGMPTGQEALQFQPEALSSGGQVPRAGEAGAPTGQPQPGRPGQIASAQAANAANIRAMREGQICRGLQELASIVQSSGPGRFANARFAASEPEPGRIENVFPCPPVYEKYPELLPLAIEHAAALQGEVRLLGLYPVVGGVSLASAVNDAGGLSGDADLRSVEVTHYAIDNLQGTSKSTREMLRLNSADLTRVALNPGDVVRFNPVFTDRDNGQVLLSGEFRRPGFYDIRRGERLSQLIARAGGLTDEAYPYGAVFTRFRVKQQEQQSYVRAAT